MNKLFTDKARHVMELAEQEASRRNKIEVGTEHMLLGILMGALNVAQAMLRNLDVDTIEFQQSIEEIIQPPSKISSESSRKIPLSLGVKTAIEFALEEARNFGHNYVGTEHLLLGLFREGEGTAAGILKDRNLTLDALRGEVIAILGHGRARRPNSKD